MVFLSLLGKAEVGQGKAIAPLYAFSCLSSSVHCVGYVDGVVQCCEEKYCLATLGATKLNLGKATVAMPQQPELAATVDLDCQYVR